MSSHLQLVGMVGMVGTAVWKLYPHVLRKQEPGVSHIQMYLSQYYITS